MKVLSTQNSNYSNDGKTEVRQRLVQATRHLLSIEGRDGASSRAICALAGVGAPTIYHYFGDLDGLHRAAIDETYEQVAEAYLQGTRERGPQQGLRNGWGAFNQFARQEPLMCRLVIQHILAGDPPMAVAETLATVEADLSRLYNEGVLSCPAHEAVQLLWIGTLGTACFTASGSNREDQPNPDFQEKMVSLVLDALFIQKG
ncbi:TetR/AcrR family transcriptional regulator [Pseudomonas sp. FME51]|uniref:TetR/AcrR family transcriptional regulator n=1 Tax=Pseudomonas sp. FME51 TaxID=2742609 RepID=UPI001866AF2E|nr:TetR/AcrR family transcriptional regulator [Pseudomonas sp. FME51]